MVDIPYLKRTVPIVSHSYVGVFHLVEVGKGCCWL